MVSLRRAGPLRLRLPVAARGGDAVDGPVLVRGADEPCFEGARRKVDPTVQHAVEERPEPVQRLLAGLPKSWIAVRLSSSTKKTLKGSPPPARYGARPLPASALPTSPEIVSATVSSCWYAASVASRNVVRPAAAATGFPDNVPAWYTEPAGARCDMTSARPPNPAAGNPPPMTLPERHQVRLPPSRAPSKPQYPRYDAEAGHDLAADEQRAVLRTERGEHRVASRVAARPRPCCRPRPR